MSPQRGGTSQVCDRNAVFAGPRWPFAIRCSC